MENVSTPIAVTPNSALPTGLTFVQYVVAAVGGWAVGQGYLNQGAVEAIGSTIAIVLPAAIGVYKTWRNNEQKKTLTKYVPDAVAYQKGS